MMLNLDGYASYCVDSLAGMVKGFPQLSQNAVLWK